MFDTMTVTKWGGALCGALLIFLLLNWAGDIIYGAEGGHGDHAEAAYLLEVDDADSGGDDTPVEAVDMVALVAAADAGKGEKVFAKCKACHKLEEGANGTGPTLYAIVGKAIGAEPGFNYSAGLAALGGTWTIEQLSAFVAKPKALVPDTKMGFAGLKKDSDRADLIAYLQTIGN